MHSTVYSSRLSHLVLLHFTTKYNLLSSTHLEKSFYVIFANILLPLTF